MFLTLLVPPLLVLVAILIRGLAASRPRAVSTVAILVPALALGLWGCQIGLTHSAPVAIWKDDSIARAGLLVSLCVPLVISWIEASPHLLASTFWSAGMLGLASLSSVAIVQSGALLFSILPLLFYGRTTGLKNPQVNMSQPAGIEELVPAKTFSRSLLVQHSGCVLGCFLFLIGFTILTLGRSSSAAGTVGMVFLACGLGGMLGWFPFPRVASRLKADLSPGAVLGKRFLPVITAAIVIYRLTERQPLATYPASLLVLAALFSLALCGIRLLHEERLSRRLTLGALSTFSFLLIAIVLQNWEFAHAERDWQASSNLSTGTAVFISILACETAGLLVLASTFRAMNVLNEENEYLQTLSGAAQCQPVLAWACLAGVLTAAGIPPFPGFWWRMSMMSSLLLPHRLSNVTRLTEADGQFLLLAILLLGLLILHAAAHLRLLQQILFFEPFRIRESLTSVRNRIAVCLAVLLLLLVFNMPVSLETMISHSEGDGIINTLEDVAATAAP